MKVSVKIAIISAVMLFASPWIHYLAYINLHAAVPSLSEDNAHGVAVFMAVIAPFFGAFLVGVFD